MTSPGGRDRMPWIFGAGALVALVVMLVLVWVGPGSGTSALSALPSGSLSLGVVDDQVATVAPPQVAARLDRIRATGVRVAGVPVSWADVAAAKPENPSDPNDPAYSWSALDVVFDGLKERQIRAIVSFSGTPGWANGNKGSEWAPDSAAFTDFVRAFAARYGHGRADIIAYEPWNEPNNPAYLMPQWAGAGSAAKPASPATYAGLVSDVRSATGGTGAAVIGPSTADISTSAPGVGGISVTDFVTALTEVSPAPKFDATAQHFQPSSAPSTTAAPVPSIGHVADLIALFDRIAPGRDLLITRLGYSTAPGGLTPDHQATALTDTVNLLRATPRVRLMMWGPLVDTLANPAGLVASTGASKPALDVFRRMPKVLATEGS